jgi:adenosylcobinamide-phosphate synthase
VTPLLLAIALDLLLGEPPNRFHPVAWIGRALDRGTRLVPDGPPWPLVVGGGLVVLAVTAAAAGAAWLAATAASAAGLAGIILEACALKCAFSLRALGTAALEVRDALGVGELARARGALARHLVSRRARRGPVASGAVESVAEEPHR